MTQPIPTRDQTILEFYPLVQIIAGRLANRMPGHVDRDDLVSSGMVGLLEAVDRYDPSRGVALKTFIEIRVNGAMVDYLRWLGWTPRSVRRKAQRIEDATRSFTAREGRRPDAAEAAAELGVEPAAYAALRSEADTIHLLSLDAPTTEDEGTTLAEVVESDARTAEECLAANQMVAMVEAGLDRLSERQRTVLELVTDRGLTLREAGEMLGVTESRVCQIRTQAIGTLRNHVHVRSRAQVARRQAA
jgi:RNA polymerase sigma factor FliA